MFIQEQYQYNPDESNMKPHQKALNALLYEVGHQELEYADNFRVARKDDQRQVAEYEEQFENGCCGFFDTCVKIDGINFMIGCNYGH